MVPTISKHVHQMACHYAIEERWLIKHVLDALGQQHQGQHLVRRGAWGIAFPRRVQQILRSIHEWFIKNGQGSLQAPRSDPHPMPQAVDAGVAIRAALTSGRLCDFFLLVASVLTTYNSGSPYVSLDEWYGDPCSDCGRRMHENDSISCENCEQDYCSACTGCCDCCDQTHCLGCLKTCTACKEDLCDHCR
ncbi:MAG: hypothetical protein WD294_14755 [Phycisphaeraceae bacterium]